MVKMYAFSRFSAFALWAAFTGFLIWVALSLANGIVTRAEELALRRATSGAATLANHVKLQFDILHRVGLYVQRAMQDDGPGIGDNSLRIPTQASRHLQDILLARRPLINWLGIIDTNSSVLWSPPPETGTNAPYLQSYFTAIAETDTSPNVGSLFSNDWMPTPLIPFNFKIKDEFGVTKARLIALMDAFALSRELEVLEPGTGAAATLIAADGTIIARSREPLRTIGLQLPAAKLLAQRIAANPRGSNARVHSYLDSRPKLAAYQQVESLPIYAVLALDREDEVEPFAFAYPLLLSAAGAISILSLLLGVLWFMYLHRRQMEARLHHSQQQAQEMEAQLAHTHRMEALGSLAGGIAHDFNNVIQAVIAGAASIQRRTSDEAIQRILVMLNDSAQRGASITRRLLSFARRAELRKEETEILGLFRGLEEVLKHTLGNGIRIVFVLPEVLPKIFVDRSQLESTLINLAVNARDAMEGQEGGNLTVTVSEALTVPGEAKQLSLKPGPYTRITITDTGTGMDAETLRRAFEPFFTTKGVGKGTGLGLSMAKGFAEQSGGALQIQSELGAGTTIAIWLPSITGSVSLKNPRSELGAVASTTTNEPAASGKQLLLVDDDETIREMLGAELREFGWKVTTAASGGDALNVLMDSCSFDLLVTDLSMPRMDGLTLIRAARKLCPGFPALLITGHAGTTHTETLKAAASSGVFELMNKPVDAEDLSIMAEILLQQAKVPRNA
jgi:signal transduction histidine kinase/ActR/RegA family two-component response regulator